MSEKPTRQGNPEPPSRARARSSKPATPTESTKRLGEEVRLIEVRSGLFLNLAHVVSVRVLAQGDRKVYAVLQLSNGDKQDLTGDEFTAITGQEVHLPDELARIWQGDSDER